MVILIIWCHITYSNSSFHISSLRSNNTYTYRVANCPDFVGTIPLFGILSWQRQIFCPYFPKYKIKVTWLYTKHVNRQFLDEVKPIYLVIHIRCNFYLYLFATMSYSIVNLCACDKRSTVYLLTYYIDQNHHNYPSRVNFISHPVVGQ